MALSASSSSIKPGNCLSPTALPPGEQGVDVPALGDDLARPGAVRQRVPLDNSDATEVVRENPRGQKARHAAPDHDGVSSAKAPAIAVPAVKTHLSQLAASSLLRLFASRRR